MIVDYEPDKFEYIVPEIKRTYLPDFKLADNVYVETKGKLDIDDRKKLILFTQQYPDIRLILVFMNANNKLRKNSKTTYGDWATKQDIEWYDKVLPSSVVKSLKKRTQQTGKK